MLSIENRDKLPKKAGIYRVLDGNRNVIYVGQAKDIHSRWNKSKHHKLDDIKDYCKTNKTDAFLDWVLLSQDELLNRAENCAFRFHKPILNESTPPIV